MELISVNEENFDNIIKLKTKAEDKGFVDSPLYSLAECFLDHDHMRAFGIYDNHVLIGFTSTYFKDDFGQIINFFISDQYQNKSFGRKAVGILIDIFENFYKLDSVSVGVYKDNKGAFDFWTKQGFIDTGNIEGEYIYLRKFLNKIPISKDLYLVNYFPAYKLSLEWYQDKETVKMVDNIDDVYSIEDLKRMYTYLSKNGDLYYIVYDDKLVGDCAIFDRNFLAIVIDKNYRNIKIGKKVLAKLIDLGREKDLDYLQAEIYDFNQASLALFKGKGFKKMKKELYRLDL